MALLIFTALCNHHYYMLTLTINKKFHYLIIWIVYSLVVDWFYLNLPFWHLKMQHAAAAKSLQSCPTLCDPIDGSPPGSPVPGIRQARTLEWVATSVSNAWKWKVKVKSLSRLRLFATPMDCSLPGSSIHGIFQARVLEWGALYKNNFCKYLKWEQ